MANEVQIRASLQIRKTNTAGDLVLIDHRSYPTAFTSDVSGTKGPTPGALTITAAGENISLAELTYPGWAMFFWMGMADGSDNTGAYVEIGVHDGSLFHPWLELSSNAPAAGPFHLSRNLGVEEDVPGTGTSGVVNALFARAAEGGPDQIIRVEVFER